jgi:hypothetical protein
LQRHEVGSSFGDNVATESSLAQRVANDEGVVAYDVDEPRNATGKPKNLILGIPREQLQILAPSRIKPILDILTDLEAG